MSENLGESKATVEGLAKNDRYCIKEGRGITENDKVATTSKGVS